MNLILKISLIAVGLINFAPVLGVISAARLEQAYGISLNAEDLIILMRHRALLFGILGGYVLYSVYQTRHQWPAMLMAGVSMLGFILLSWLSQGHNQSLNTILMIDWVGVVFLALAIFAKLKTQRA